MDVKLSRSILIMSCNMNTSSFKYGLSRGLEVLYNESILGKCPVEQDISGASISSTIGPKRV
jgi:hypothetical protein